MHRSVRFRVVVARERRPAHRRRLGAGRADALAWMVANGHPDAALTPAGADRGIDIVAAVAVAGEVAGAKVPRADVQCLAGAAAGRRAYFFARQEGRTTPYSAQAIEWAEAHGVTLLGLDDLGRVHPWSRQVVA